MSERRPSGTGGRWLLLALLSQAGCTGPGLEPPGGGDDYRAGGAAGGDGDAAGSGGAGGLNGGGQAGGDGDGAGPDPMDSTGEPADAGVGLSDGGLDDDAGT